MEHKRKRIAVLGAGESGAGTAYLAKRKGLEVFVSDSGAIRESVRQEFAESGISYEEGGHTLSRILSADEVMKSPGISQHTPLIQTIRSAGIPIISEIEFAGRYTHAKMLCITGSNGKTTTTSLLYHMLSEAGLNVGMAGNIGSSLARQVADTERDFYVLELSSFQLEDMHDFRADVAILLNITPDHLDQYEYDIRKYATAKMRIIQNMRPEDSFIYCADDQEILHELGRIKIKSHRYPFSLKDSTAASYSDGESLRLRVMGQESWSLPIAALALKGKHNLYNAMAAALAGQLIALSQKSIEDALASFQGVPHRMETVATIDQVRYINDSKATNIDATWYALDSLSEPTVWIAGGKDKGNDYSALLPLVREKVKTLICLTTDSTKLIAAYKGVVPTVLEARSMREAVELAACHAASGMSVLLSPACASFDLFKNYEDRGDQFRELVQSQSKRGMS